MGFASVFKEMGGGTNQLVEEAKLVAEAAGWIIDLYDDVSPRIHMHGPSGHFEVYKKDSYRIGLRHCTGYSAGLQPDQQPGVSPEKEASCYSLADYNGNIPEWKMAATSRCLFAQGERLGGSGFNNQSCFGLGFLGEKIGSWTGGAFLHGVYHTSNYDEQPLFTGAHIAVLVNGSWIPDVNFGDAKGFRTNDALRTEHPNYFNGAILPQPVLICAQNVNDASLYHPLGYIDDVFFVTGGDVYLEGDQFTLGADTYEYFPKLVNMAFKTT